MVIVKIFGEEYPITGSDDPTHICRVADHLDKRMHDVSRRSKTMARDKVAILAALSLASELQEKSERLSGLQGEQEQRIDVLLSKLDEQLVLTEQLV